MNRRETLRAGAAFLLAPLAALRAKPKPKQELWENHPPLNGQNILIQVTSPGGCKRVLIDYSGDAVRYCGDLPVEESARIFFDAVGELLLKARHRTGGG